MSISAPNHYVQEYNTRALHVYQAGGFSLRNTTTPPEKITGEKMWFMIYGAIAAEEDVKRGDEAKPINGNDTRIDVDTKKSRAFVEVYEDDLDQMTVDRKAAEAMRSATALGRTHDMTVVRALNAATEVVGSYASLMTVQALVQGKQKLMQKNVIQGPDRSVFCAVDSVSWAQLTGDKRVASKDYNGPSMPYIDGNLAFSWNGMHVFCLADDILREKDAALQATCLMWHRSSIGFGYVRQLTTNVDWDNRKECWTHNMRMRIGSKLLLPEGVVKVRALYDPTAISIPVAN